MGADIHPYIEYDKAPDFTWQFAQVRLARDYRLFSLLAGVRHEPSFGQPSVPKGLPANLCPLTRLDNELCVVENDSREKGVCTKEQAERWVASGMSEWTSDEHKWVTNPDWHSHSWMNWRELEEVKQKFIAAEGHTGNLIELDAVIAAMKTLDPDPTKTRLVFWFDN